MTAPQMSAGDALGAAGAPVRLTFRGHTHPVSPPTARVIDRVEKLVAFRVNAAAHELADTLPAADAHALRQSVLDDLKARRHATGGPLWAAEFAGDGGQRGTWLMLFACLEEGRAEEPEKDSLPPPLAFEDMPDVLAESPDAAAVVAVLLPDFIRAAGRKGRLPAAAVQRITEQAVKALASPPA